MNAHTTIHPDVEAYLAGEDPDEGVPVPDTTFLREYLARPAGDLDDMLAGWGRPRS